MNMFSLHPQLAKDSFIVGELPLSTVLLCNDANYPWVILVPRREGIREAYQLNETDQLQLLKENNAVAELMNKHFAADKMNVAALGNQVPQLHIHHIARYQSDAAWPGPIWGAVANKPYMEEQKEQRLQELRQIFDSLGLEVP
jgi:diadenosine tetraphosphate (Ap4A) HIT family hydrolase